jgi:hypothetical protein
MNGQLIAVRSSDHGPGEGRAPILRETGLYRTPKRKFGKRFYLTAMSNPASQTWIDDARASRWLKIEGTVQIDKAAE